MFGWLFGSAPKKRQRGWNDANPFRDIGEGMGKGPRRRGGGGGRRQARPNRCPRCPTLEDRIAKLKQENSRLRAENAKLKRRKDRPKGASTRGSPEYYREVLYRILGILNTRARFSDYHIPLIREEVNGALGKNTGWDSKKGRATRG